MRNNGNNEINRGTKKSFLSVLPIIGASLLAGGAIAGTAVSAWHVSRTYKESSEFANSTEATIKIDPVAFETDKGRKTDQQVAKDNTIEAATRLSAWLKEKGQESYDVSWKLEAPTESAPQYYAYLTAKFKISKVQSKLSDEQDKDKVDNDPYLSIFEDRGFNTNNKSFVYRWYEPDVTAENIDPKYTILNFSDLFVLPDSTSDKSNTKTLSDKDSKPGIVYEVKNKEFLNGVYQNLLKYDEDSKATTTSNKTIDVKCQPRIYIINNLEGLYNEANYHVLNYAQAQAGDLTSYLRLYKDSDYFKFADAYANKTWRGTERSPQVSKLGEARAANTKGEYQGENIKNGDILNWIDAATAGTVQHTTVLSKYIEDVIPSTKMKEFFKENIDDNLYKNTIPAKSGDNCDISYFWHQYSNENAAKTYFSTLIEKRWKNAKIVNIDLTSEEKTTNWNFFKTNYASKIVAPKFTTTIFGNNQLVGIMSLGFLIFLIALGIILGCLYRTTGIFSWITMMFMLSMTGLIAVFGSASVISMSLLFGLFIMSIAGFITAMAICGRMKRRLLSNEDTQVIVSKTFKQSLWPAADTSIIVLLFGICITYITPLVGLNALGLVLIIGGFANFIGTYLLNGLLHLLWFNNKITINHFGWFGRKHGNEANEALSQGDNEIPSSLDATKLEFQHYSVLGKKKIDFTSKWAMIASIVTGGLLIVSIIIFVVLGFVNSGMFQPDEFTIGTTNRDILFTCLLSTGVAVICSTVYIGIRCNWTAFVPMLAGSALPFIMLGIASACQIKFDETIVLGYTMITVINTLLCANLINTVNSVWSRHDGYNKSELKCIVNKAVKYNIFWVAIVAAAYALFIIEFGLTAPAGCANISFLLVIGFIVTFVFAMFITAYLLYRFLVIRNAALIRKANKKANKVVVNYDAIDEQGIEGLNKFTKKIPVPKKEAVSNEQK